MQRVRTSRDKINLHTILSLLCNGTFLSLSNAVVAKFAANSVVYALQENSPGYVKFNSEHKSSFVSIFLTRVLSISLTHSPWGEVFSELDSLFLQGDDQRLHRWDSHIQGYLISLRSNLFLFTTLFFPQTAPPAPCTPIFTPIYPPSMITKLTTLSPQLHVGSQCVSSHDNLSALPE